MIWRKLNDEIGLDGTKIILLNTRHDRLDRARQLAEMVGKELYNETDYLILIGQSTDVVQNMTISYGFERSKIVAYLIITKLFNIQIYNQLNPPLSLG